MVRISERRWEDQAARNAARKALLQKQAAIVEERIAIMVALCRPAAPPQSPPEHVAVSIPAGMAQAHEADATTSDASAGRDLPVPSGPEDHV